MKPPIHHLAACAIALGLVACTHYQHKSTIELRAVGVQTQEDAFQDADEPVGGALSYVSMPIQGSDNLWSWEFRVGQAEDSFDLTQGSYALSTRDAWLGTRYTFLDGHWRPYLGAGVQYTDHSVTLDFNGMSLERSTDDVGVYGEVGLQLRLTRALHLSLGYRETFGMEGDLAPLELDLDTQRAFFGVGWSF